MIVRYDSQFISKLKKLNVRLRKSFKQGLVVFINNPFDPLLDNHALKREYAGYRSIDITADYRVIYVEKVEGDELVALFVAIGTHKELYGR